MAVSGISKFTTALGDEQLILELDDKGVQLTFEVVNTSRFVAHRQVINKP